MSHWWKGRYRDFRPARTAGCGALAVLELQGGQPSLYTHILFGFALFIILLVASMIGWILATHFSVGWWAVTFPSAAIATLATQYAVLLPVVGMTLLAMLALAFASGLVLWVAILTIRGLAEGELIPRT
ncbi:hypothetical protein J7E70_18940 [Variovorax paradoxus]|nr:hypothetical protein [Variovorax paradoxus]MBT2302531.1 hypothetical protein [Variovorax paradoxus]